MQALSPERTHNSKHDITSNLSRSSRPSSTTKTQHRYRFPLQSSSHPIPDQSPLAVHAVVSGMMWGGKVANHASICR